MRMLTGERIDAILARNGIDAAKGHTTVAVPIERIRSAIQSAYRLGLDAELMKAEYKQTKGDGDEQK